MLNVAFGILVKGTKHKKNVLNLWESSTMSCSQCFFSASQFNVEEFSAKWLSRFWYVAGWVKMGRTIKGKWESVLLTFLNGKCSAGFLGQLQVRWYWIAMYSARGFRKKLGSRNVNLKRSWDPFTSQWIGLTWLVEIWQECQTRDGPIDFDNHE